MITITITWNNMIFRVYNICWSKAYDKSGANDSNRWNSCTCFIVYMKWSTLKVDCDKDTYCKV